MKVLLMSLFILLLFTPGVKETGIDVQIKDDYTVEQIAMKSAYDTFHLNASFAYDVYVQYVYEETDTYIYSIYLGEYKERQYFDVFYYSTNQDYVIRLDYDGVEYGIVSSQDDYVYYCSANGLEKKNNQNIKVYLFNGIISTKTVTIPNDYNSTNKEILTGVSQGVTLSYPEPIDGASDTLILIVTISVAVIFLCLIALGVFFVLKKGKKFARPMGYEKKKAVINYNNVYKPTYSEPQEKIEIQVVTSDSSFDDAKNNSNESQETNNEEIKEHQETQKEINLQEMLLQRGFKTDYSSMTEEEKNEVMVYLMILRKNNILTFDRYQEEVVKLWRK